ncbi:MAG: helix-turn-helix transcriptional regulator [Saccharospirillaceae bacterium]|nr:helix-turn-helix transcriptional regulator [Pseudomonadales bacterium]NRB79916.1 helix-turn-helix transcriptional regulator [Saccharospirillaceae bacterium]
MTQNCKSDSNSNLNIDLKYPCPAVATLLLLNSKWAPMLIHCLAGGPHLFGQIHRALNPISKKVLAQELKKLERNSLVDRHEIVGNVITVKYTLTARGESLLPILETLFKWGYNNINHDQLDLLYWDGTG